MASTGPCSEFDMAESKRFTSNVSRLRCFQFSGDERTKSTLGLLLDELIAVDPRVSVLRNNQEGSELLSYLSRIIPPYQDRLVAKMCLLTCSFCVKRNVELSTGDLQQVVQFLTDSLQQCQTFVYADILCALAAVCENNTHRIQKFHDSLVGGRGILVQLTDDTTCEDEVVLEAVKCLAAFCNIKPPQAEHVEVQYLSACFDTFVHLLHRAPHLKMCLALKNKLLISCFSGIQSIVLLKRLPNIELGTLFAAVRAYLFYGLTSHPMNIPSQLFPNVVTPYDPLTSPRPHPPKVNSAETKGSGEGDTNSQAQGKPGASTPVDSGRKKPKKRRGKGRGGGDDKVAEDKKGWDEAQGPGSNTDGASASSVSAWSSVTPEVEALAWDTSLLRVSSSDSEYSDTEGGRQRHQRSEAVRVRHSALICFLNIVRVVEKKVMFGYWSSFLPDYSATATAQQTQSLFTAILKDPSPVCRMAAVASLTCMLEATRNLLAAAQDSGMHHSAPAFTTFSAALGATCREMHRCLLQALVAENSNSVLTQIIKCLAHLVSNVPYHRLNPGLLAKVLKQIRHFFNHKDSNVRTAVLTCIGAMVGIRPPLMEVSQLIRPPVPPVGVNRSANPGDSPLFRPEDAAYLLYPSFSTPQVPRVKEEGEEPNSAKVEQADRAERNSGSVKEEGEEPNSAKVEQADRAELNSARVKEEGEEPYSAKVEKADKAEPNSARVKEEGEGMKSAQGEGPNSEGSMHGKEMVLGTDTPKEIDEVKSAIPSAQCVSECAIDDVRDKQRSVVVSCTDNEQKTCVVQDSATTYTGAQEETSDTESAVHSRSGVASSAEGRTPVLAASSGEATPKYRDLGLQSMARETSWVIKFSVKNVIGQPDTEREQDQARSDGQQRFEPLPIRLEALQVVSNLVKNYFPVIRQSVGLLRDLIQTCVEDTNPTIQLHGCKVLDEFTQALHREVQDGLTQGNKQVIPVKEIEDFWLYLLEGCLPKLLAYNPEVSADSNNLLRSAACESMGNIGEEVFSQLPVRRQMQCVTLVLGMVVEDDKLIKAAAVRALGIYILYPSLREDVPFVLDSASAILSCMESKSQMVRFKAAWAMANLCDTLVANKDNKVDEFMQDFPDKILLQLLQCAASATRDSDKISCNSGRAIGNLLRFMPGGCFQQPDMGQAVHAAVKGLVKNMTSGAMKVRWNSCYAASNAFRNCELPVDQTWISDILHTLSKVVHTCPNFKVRINAALGLCGLRQRPGYGTSVTFSGVWEGLVTALESAENINNFAEYKYKDSLIEHLCGAVLHVTSLAELHDLSFLRQSVHLKGHSFRTYMDKYVRLDLTKKDAACVPTVDRVKQHLESLQAQAASDDQRRCLQDLLQACVPDTDSPEDRPVEKTSFKQIYD